MVKAKNYIGVLLAMILPMALMARTQHPADQQHNHRQSGVAERGDHTMGFSHEKTTHHFRLTAEGGSIEVTAKDAKDTASIEQIQKHLAHIAKMFKEGNFEAPMLIHGENPPGVATMKKLKSEIDYTCEEIQLGLVVVSGGRERIAMNQLGGRVRIATANAEAIESIHEFLRYQIKEHRTGDPLER